MKIEVTSVSAFSNGIRKEHTVIILTQPDGSTNRYEGKSSERKDESPLHLIINRILVCYQCEANREIARLLNIPQELDNSQDLSNSQVSCKNSADSTITSLLEKSLNSVLLVIRKERPLLMPYVCNESISYLLGEKGMLKEIDDLNAVNSYSLSNKKATDNEINDVKVSLFHILIDSLDDARVNPTPIVDSILEIFLEFPYINDVGVLDWCFNKRMQYFGDSEKIKYAYSVIDHTGFSRDQSKDFNCGQSRIKIAETLFSDLDKEHYKNSRKLQELIWDKLAAYVNGFNLSNQERSRLILRLSDDAKLLFSEVLVSILINDTSLKDFFMKQLDFTK